MEQSLIDSTLERVRVALKALKMGPAHSGVIVTAATDVVGFGLFLGLATQFFAAAHLIGGRIP